MANKIVKLNNINKVKEEGSLWLAKLDRDLSPEEEVQLKLWLAESKENRDYFMALAKRWDQLSVLSKLADIIPYESNAVKGGFSFYAKAATFAFVFLLGAFLFNTTNSFYFDTDELALKPIFTKYYSTSVGEKSTIHLPDSSILTLNTDSLVRIKFTSNKRLVTLEKGEVHIKVAHNKERKLILSAGDKSFIAIGTAFNVRYDKKSTFELIVTEGKVGIAGLEHTNEVEALFSDPDKNNQLLVNAGERVIIPPENTLSNNKMKKENIKNKVADSLAWREGKVIFKGETLEKVIYEMSRYSDIEFDFELEELKNIRIGGRFRTGDIDGFLDVLHQQFNIESNRLSTSHIQLSQNKAVM